MKYVSRENDYQQLLQQQLPVVKVSYANGQFTDAWFSETSAPTYTSNLQGVQLRETPNGLLGYIETAFNHQSVVSVTKESYLRLFEAMECYTDYTVIRFWNYVPEIIAPAADSTGTVYHLFNEGRQAAFIQYYGSDLATLPVPAASAVGTQSTVLRIEFLAVKDCITQIENKSQIPAYKYSEQYGKVAPFFSRGVIFNNNGQKILLSSGTASIKGETSLHAGDIYEQVSQSIHNLRLLGSQFNLKQYSIHYGFALEDISILRVYYKHAQDRAFLERFIPKFLSSSCEVSFMQADICRDELLVELEAVFIKKGETEAGAIRDKYFIDNNRIKTESFEVHVAEHCNLKCRDCCNISPYNAKKFISIEEVEEICRFVQRELKPDVFKVAGGEPTLHPQLDGILQTIRKLCPDTRIRVVSNGLLLHRMSDIFWQNIDQLTVSNYNSAPVKPHLVEQIKAKARANEVVLNIKYIDQFNEIFVEEKMTDEDGIQQIYNDCWMRHRCLIVRNGRFYKCTRAAYMDEFLSMKAIPVTAGASTFTMEDGLEMNDNNFQNKALPYLNDNTPLFSCSYCLGVSGGLRENIQMRNV